MSRCHTRSQGSSNLIPLEPELGRLERQKKKRKALEAEMAGNDDNLQLRDGYLNRNQFQGNNCGNNGFQQKQLYGNFQAHGNASTSQSSQGSEIKQMLQMVLEEQKRSTSEINSKVDNMAPPGTLPGKPEVNPKAHCNAVSAREDEEAEGSEDETEKKVVENGMINPLPKSVEPESSVKIHASTSSERVYVPRISYPVVPQHLKEPINEKTLAGFKKIMKRIPSTTSFEDAWSIAEPTNKCTRLASSISVLDQSTHVPISKEDLMEKGQVKEEKGQVKEALNKDNHTVHKKSDAKAKKKLKGKRIKGDPHLMLIPHSCSNGIIDYEVKCKGTSKPFSKARAVLTPEMKEKGMEAVKGFVSKDPELTSPDLLNSLILGLVYIGSESSFRSEKNVSTVSLSLPLKKKDKGQKEVNREPGGESHQYSHLMEAFPNKKSVMVNLGHSKLWVESGMVAKLKVKYMEVSLKDGYGGWSAELETKWSMALLRRARFGALEPAIDPPSRAEQSDHLDITSRSIRSSRRPACNHDP
ncbi:hypothetical protein F2Q70_00017571 [Brassica cretica]|uniref:Uncharacterized protein n=1 Tax=Brassica cretica TaxID=69181 RepID=A0A8S9HTB6_BRACR|nr:hypothetical protein F2Q70_00017571 [Brassica cretica]